MPERTRYVEAERLTSSLPKLTWVFQRAANQKKGAQNLNNANATPSADGNGEGEAPTPATPITPVNPGNFNKNGQNNGGGPGNQPAATAPTAAAPTVPAPQPDRNQNGSIHNDFTASMVSFSKWYSCERMCANDWVGFVRRYGYELFTPSWRCVE
jgi:hypothetical protein